MIDLLLFLSIVIHGLFSNRYYFNDKLFSKLGYYIFLSVIYIYVSYVLSYSSVYILMILVVVFIDLLYLCGIKKRIKYFMNNAHSYLTITTVLIYVPLIQPTVLLFTK